MTYGFEVEFYPERKEIKNIVIQFILSQCKILQNYAKWSTLEFSFEIVFHHVWGEFLPKIDRSHDIFKIFDFLKPEWCGFCWPK